MGNSQQAKRARATGAVLAVLMMATACSPSGGDANGSAPTANGAISGSATADSENAGPPTTQEFDCSDPIWSGNDLAQVAAGAAGVPGLMAITLEHDTMAWTDGSVSLGDLYFQKVGLALKTGAAMGISIPSDLRGHMKIGWSNTGSVVVDDLKVSGCESDPPGDEWVVYPGGFWVEEPGCVPLDITSGGRTTTVQVPIGESCA